MWTAPEASGLVRAHKDAHVMAMCLAVYWHRCESDDVQQALHKACSDLVLEARKLGHGAAFSGQKLKLVEAEEEQRKVIGLSAYRKCLCLVTVSEQVQKEGLFVEAKSNADKIMMLLQQSDLKVKTWNVDTVKRYLSIGKRLDSAEVRSLIDRWMFLEQSGAMPADMDDLRRADR